MDMHNDISKRTVLVLLVLTLVVSVVGTWTVLSMPKEIHETRYLNPTHSAEVRLNIGDPSQITEPTELPPSSTSGGAQVAVNIVK